MENIVFNSGILLKEYFNNYFLNLSEVNKSRNTKIAYASSMAPVEILQAFGFKVYFPENHAVMLGVKNKKKESDYLQAREHGLSENCCSYMLADIESDFIVHSPLDKYNLPPAPDLIVYNTTQCIEVKYWLTYYAKKYQVPMFGIETPHVIELSDSIAQTYVAKQLEQLITDIEDYFNIEFNYDLFNQAVKNTKEASKLWKEVISFGKLQPAYIDFFNLCRFMAPMVLTRAESKTVDFYKSLIDELSNIKEQKKFSQDKEQIRLIWCGLPLWGSFKPINNTLNRLNAVLVNSTYTNSWIFDLDEENPIESMAKVYSGLFINRTEEEKLKYLLDIIKEFSVQGIIFHHSLSCKRNSDNYYGLSKNIKDMLNVPSITFEADHNNIEKFDNRRFSTSLETLIDIIERK